VSKQSFGGENNKNRGGRFPKELNKSATHYAADRGGGPGEMVGKRDGNEE